MHIRRIQYARVPQIRMLNHNFRPERKHLVVTLDVEGYAPPATNDFLRIYHALADLFPTLSKHTCCEEWENTPLYLNEQQGVAIKWVNEPADVAHLVEHVIVDLQCAISDMRICSGITCGHRTPENRFDLFIECVDPRIGAFSAQFAAYLVAAMFSKPRLSHHYRDIVRSARFLVHPTNGDGAVTDGIDLARRLAWWPARGCWAYAALQAFGFWEFEEGNGHDHGD
ncbi:MAG: hypothetical protein HY304_04255 [candidate division Zixibacteria bacterium]|nr:hypothetical protein [candidate division Zixibacteria bacterium]